MAASVTNGADLRIVGGAYRERCLHPAWTEVFGSGGRAASAVAAMGRSAHLTCYGDDSVAAVLSARAALDGFAVDVTSVEQSPLFDYVHGLATPQIQDVPGKRPALRVAGPAVLRFGMLEGDAVVDAAQAVYDPQNAVSPEHFGANGSRADRLALVLNRHEACLLSGRIGSVETLSEAVQHASGAEVVVIKNGVHGCFVLEKGHGISIPAYRSLRVWKLGSGDNFAAHFAIRWALEGRTADDSANLASHATAYYCDTRGFATPEALVGYAANPVAPSERCRAGRKPSIYLAGPFFTLAQLWQVDQARHDLHAAGFNVFSPYHDVGRGSASEVVAKDIRGIVDSDIVLAVADGADPGTVFEVGYARALGKPVVVYCEQWSGEHQKMFDGTACMIETDYVTAIYKASWIASAL